jgi:hypothetical protein
MVIGLLSNSKPNSEELMRDVAELLSEHFDIKGIVEARKPTNRTPATLEMLDDLAARCDAVITATAE